MSSLAHWRLPQLAGSDAEAASLLDDPQPFVARTQRLMEKLLAK